MESVANMVDKCPFWQTKTLEEMTRAEWESLCDGCGRCCLLKLEDEDTGDIGWTNVACQLLDTEKCRCTDYANRHVAVPTCIPLDADTVRRISWLPVTCAYKLIADGEELYWWHPLVSGSPDTVHQAGISVRGRVISEKDVPEDYLDYCLVEWPEDDGE